MGKRSATSVLVRTFNSFDAGPGYMPEHGTVVLSFSPEPSLTDRRCTCQEINSEGEDLSQCDYFKKVHDSMHVLKDCSACDPMNTGIEGSDVIATYVVDSMLFLELSLWPRSKKPFQEQ